MVLADQVSQIKAGVGEEPTTKSGRIRWLASQGMAVADIAKLLSIRYQQVYAVIQRDKVQDKSGSGGSSLPEGAVACKRCGRPLLDPISVRTGIGPICNEKC